MRSHVKPLIFQYSQAGLKLASTINKASVDSEPKFKNRLTASTFITHFPVVL